MENLFNIIIMALDIVGCLFGVTYIWVNTFSKYDSDAIERSAGIYKLMKYSFWLSILFTFASCIFTGKQSLYFVVQNASKLYSYISVSWIIVWALCSLVCLCILVSKRSSSDSSVRLRKLFKFSLWASLFSIFISWLLS